MRRDVSGVGAGSTANSGAGGASGHHQVNNPSMFHRSPLHHQGQQRVVIPREGSLMSMTRLQALRVVNRNRPLRLTLTIVWVCCCLALYASTVFGTVKDEGGPATARFHSVSAAYDHQPIHESRWSGKDIVVDVPVDDRETNVNGDGGGANIFDGGEEVRAEKRTLDGDTPAEESGVDLEEQSDIDGSDGDGRSDADEEEVPPGSDAKVVDEEDEHRGDGEESRSMSKPKNLRGAIDRVTLTPPGDHSPRDAIPTDGDGEDEDHGDGGVVGLLSAVMATAANDTAAAGMNGTIAGIAGLGGARGGLHRRSAADVQRDREALASASTKGFLAFTFWLMICVVIRLSVSFFVHGSAAGSESGGRTRIVFGRRGAGGSGGTQTRRQAQQARFNALVRRLNRARAEHGEGPISAESLRVVVSSRDFTGDDYDSLLRFDEENGAASASMLSSLGATRAEIDRCPSHVIQSEDDYLMASSRGAGGAGGGGGGKSCPVCLERYHLGDHVRTIPCFHTFHVDCIDPWLGQKAICPVCKHPAIG